MNKLAYLLGLFLLISSFEAKTTEECGFLYDGTMYTSMLFTEPNMKVINNLNSFQNLFS